jgi:hypothetical protein
VGVVARQVSGDGQWRERRHTLVGAGGWECRKPAQTMSGRLRSCGVAPRVEAAARDNNSR